MELIVLGNRAGLAPYKDDSSAYALLLPQKWWLFDASPQILQQINREKLRLSRLQCIYISHTHGDHCGGIFGLLSVALLNRTEPLHLCVPPELWELIDHFLQLTGKLERQWLIYHELSHQKTLHIEEYQLNIHALPHGVTSFGCILTAPNQWELNYQQLKAEGIEQNQWGEYKRQLLVGAPRYRTEKQGKRIGFIFDVQSLPTNSNWQNLDLCISEATFLAADQKYAQQYQHITTVEANEFYQQMQPRAYLVSHLSRRYHESDFQAELLPGITVATLAQRYKI